MKRIEVMNRARFVRQGDKMIFVCDLTDLDKEDAIRVVRHGEDILRRMPKKSVLAVARLANVKYDDELEAHIRHLIQQTDPYVVKGAVTGVTDRRLRVDMEVLMDSLGKDKETFASYEDAVCWLLDSEAA
jgi:hypothetical protein